MGRNSPAHEFSNHVWKPAGHVVSAGQRPGWPVRAKYWLAISQSAVRAEPVSGNENSSIVQGDDRMNALCEITELEKIK